MHRLLHPLFALAVAVLLINDRVLKLAVPGMVTGKLSDVAGLIVLPVLLCAVLSVTTRRMVWGVHAAVGVAFAAMQFVPAGPWLDALSWIAGVQLHHTADAADVFALVALPLGGWIASRPLSVCPSPRRAALAVPVAAVALVAVMGTSIRPTLALISDEPLVQADGPAAAFVRMERAFRAAGLEAVRFDTPRAAALGRSAHATTERRLDSVAVVREAEGRRWYGVTFQHPVLPADTLLVSVSIWTRWRAPDLVAEAVTATARWTQTGRPAVRDAELRAIVHARVLRPLQLAGGP